MPLVVLLINIVNKGVINMPGDFSLLGMDELTCGLFNIKCIYQFPNCDNCKKKEKIKNISKDNIRKFL